VDQVESIHATDSGADDEIADLETERELGGRLQVIGSVEGMAVVY
jgi:hypothetical protein